MANYVIGDIQGCFDEFQTLLALIEFDPVVDHLYLVGDLVNRGPKSLATLRWVYQQRGCVSTVLGNHDLHLLACWMGLSQPKRGDTLSEILSAIDVDDLLQWLQQQPLARMVDDVCIVHAGVYPSWSLADAMLAANKAHKKYSGKKAKSWFAQMYGNKPTDWNDAVDEVERFRFTINAFTRMRFCLGSNIDLKYKGELEGSPAGLRPWFDYPRDGRVTIACGHWSALGLRIEPGLLALDTGCIWGGQLTAVRLSDRAIFQVDALSPYQSIE